MSLTDEAIAGSIFFVIGSFAIIFEFAITFAV